MTKRKKMFFPFLALAGAVLVAGGFFADRFGLDNHGGWGRMRIATVVAGVLVLLLSAVVQLYDEKVRAFFSDIKVSFNRNATIVGRYGYTLPLVVLVLVIYVWIISAGTWTSWHSPSKYYADLARGFLNGTLHLDSTPDPGLLKLPDPYDFKTWGMLQVPLDVSLYKGEYYLYWGPVPALLLAFLSPLIGTRVGDVSVTFAFVSGLFLLLYILCLIVWDRFFRNLPRSLLLLSILVIGLAGPIPFALESSVSARIYEAAIAGGQFFLIGGFLTALLTLSAPRRKTTDGLGLALTGCLWALAIATRLVLALPIAGLVVMSMIRIYQLDGGKWKSIVGKWFILGLPLGLGFIGLGWYNWARFGTLTETGLYYQLAGMDIQRHYKELMAPDFIIQNLYNYFLLPFQTGPNFPFIHAVLGVRTPVFSWYSFSPIYNAQHVTGMLYTAPFSAFAVLPLGMWVRRAFPSRSEEDWKFFQWIIVSLGVSSFLTLGMLLFFFWAAMRYQLDFTPSLFLLSVIFFWRGYQFFDQSPHKQKIILLMGISLAFVSVVISMLLAISMGKFSLPMF